MSVIWDCLGGDWVPRFGDRGLQPWITVLVYLTCGFLAVSVWRGQTEPVLRRFWGFIAVLMLFFALNKQLDLQTALTETGRCLSRAQGWHGYRRYVQMMFIILLTAGVLLVLLRGTRMMRDHLRTHWMALSGTALVGAYVLIRAISFHAIDILSGRQVMGLSVNFILENAGLVLIALNALALRRQARAAARGENAHLSGPGPFVTTPPRMLPPSGGEAFEAGQREFRTLPPRGH